MPRRRRHQALWRLAASASALRTVVATASSGDKCHTAVPGEPCYEKVRWSMREGIFSHPEWYSGLDRSSSFEEFQLVASRDAANGCPTPCLLAYHISRRVAYRSEPRPLIRGMAYGPSPETTRGKDLPNDDFTSEQAAGLWASWGRGDLATMRALGANTVRLYGNDPRVNKRAFLDEALRNNLGVIVGISDYPYLQAPDACKNGGFDCFDNIYDSYKENLLNGLTINGHTAYHPAVKAIIVINEPELKFKHPTGDCKAVISAVDAMLQAEKDLGVTGNPVAFTVAYSLAPKFGLSATGSMAHLYKCFMRPARMAKYKPENDVTNAYLTRWINSFNTPTKYYDQRVLLERYGRIECWRGKVRIPVMIGEYHSPHVDDQLSDLHDMFNLVHDNSFPYYMGYCFFEFQKRYDKSQNAEFEMKFGMFGLDQKCVMAEMEFAGMKYPIHALYPSGHLDKAVANTFGGETLHHPCRRLDDQRLLRSGVSATPRALPGAERGGGFDAESWARAHPELQVKDEADAEAEREAEAAEREEGLEEHSASGAGRGRAGDLASSEDASGSASSAEASEEASSSSSEPCYTARRGEVCFDAVRWAMQTDIRDHPERYGNLSAASPFEAFQQHFFEDAGRSNCSRPCTAAPAVPVAEDASGCRAVVPGEACYDAIRLAMRSGIAEHPDAYAGLDQNSAFEEVQAFLAQEPKLGCPRPCPLKYSVTSAIKYRSWPKPLVKGIAYGPSPETKRGAVLPTDDFTSLEVAALWASWGRGDIATMRALGANTIRLYGNDPRVNKRSFLDEALRQRMDVILGISDYPYVQAADSCSKNGFDCFQIIYDSYKQNLLNGLTIKGRSAYHPAVKAVVVINEPELKIKHGTSECKAVVSAVDAMLQAERDLGVVGNPVALSVAYSLAQKFGQAATGSMAHLYKCFMNPSSMAQYTPKNDVKKAYLTRWVNSLNSPTENSLQRSILKQYSHLEAWRPRQGVNIPVLISEYHCPMVNQFQDLPAMLSDAGDPTFPFYLGFCFFEFQKRYDKAQNAAFEMTFGMYSLNMKCSLTEIDFGGKRFSLHPLVASDQLELAVARTFGGSPPPHKCQRLPGAPPASDIRGSEEDEVAVGGDEGVGSSNEADVEEAEGEAEAVAAAEDLEGDVDLDEAELGMSKSVEYGVHDWTGPLKEAVVADFERYAAENGLADALTPEELERYKYRFMANAKNKAVAMDIEGDLTDSQEKQRAWNDGLQRAIVDEMPAITAKLASKVNEANVGWEASTEAVWSKDLTMHDASALMGFVHDPEIENTTLEHFSEDIRRLQNFPHSFDSRQQWPQCAETIGHVRDQGKCGSCWAMATAGSMDGRLCIASNGAFSGPNAWTSAGYIASCYNMLVINGCSGGNPGFALTRIKKTFLPIGGVPTGSEHGSTCVPYFGSGDALSHFDGKNMKAPSCPGRCTGDGYPRDLRQDKFYSSSMPSTSTNLADAKRALMEAGPIPMAFQVFQDFMAYKSGYYERTTDKQMGGHATTLIGWESGEYLVSSNSWGRKWGENGYFKMRASCCGVSYFIAQVSGQQKALPLPAGPQDLQGIEGAHRRRRGTGPLAKIRQGVRQMIQPGKQAAEGVRNIFRPRNPFRRRHDITGEDNFTEEEEEFEEEEKDGGSHVAALDALGSEASRVQVVMALSNVSCEDLTLVSRKRIRRAASLAVVGKLSMLLPEAVVLNLLGASRSVSLLPCSETASALDATASAAIWPADAGARHCAESHGPERADGEAVAVAFVVAMPAGATADHDWRLVDKKVDESSEAVGRRVGEALGGAHPVRRRCLALLPAPEPTADTSSSNGRAASTGSAVAEAVAKVGAEVATDFQLPLRAPRLAVPLLLLAGAFVASFVVIRRRRRRRRDASDSESGSSYSSSGSEEEETGAAERGTRRPLVSVSGRTVA